MKGAQEEGERLEILLECVLLLLLGLLQAYLLRLRGQLAQQNLAVQVAAGTAVWLEDCRLLSLVQLLHALEQLLLLGGRLLLLLLLLLQLLTLLGLVLLVLLLQKLLLLLQVPHAPAGSTSVDGRCCTSSSSCGGAGCCCGC